MPFKLGVHSIQLPKQSQRCLEKHAFVNICAHSKKFVFNLESVSMYKSGLLWIRVVTIMELFALLLNID